MKPSRHVWIQVVKGGIELNGETLSESDGAAVSQESKIQITAKEQSEILLFDLN